MNIKYFIGCSGYYYPGWKNGFYPKDLRPKDWLTYYSTVFNTVELNGTFYRKPKVSDLQKQADATPKDFRFSVKMSRYITHMLKLKDSKQSIVEFQDEVLEGLDKKLSFFLFQFPASFHYNEENVARIIENIPHVAHNVIEFRHVSWWSKDIKKIFTKAGLTFCNVDYPGLKSPYLNTSSSFYLRLHGKPELFKSSYSKIQLRNFNSKIPPQIKSRTIYFNNTYYAAAYENALQLMEIVSKKSKNA